MSCYTKRDMQIAKMIDRSPEIVNWAIDYIQDKLPDYEGSENYGCDFAGVLTEVPNVNGCYIVGSKTSWEFITEHINDARDEYDYQVSNFGKPLHNPFEDPEGFVVCMLIDVVKQIMSEVSVVDEHWDDCWELTADDIKEILTFLGRGEEHPEDME